MRLAPAPEPPAWVHHGHFFSVTQSEEELSVVCESHLVPAGAQNEPGWRAIKVQGPLHFSEVGILARLSDTLAANGVSVFVISTYDTDYILVRATALRKALDALTEAGHVIKN